MIALQLDGKVAVVTGGGRGLGAAAAWALAEERQFALGEEATAWIANQILESFMASAHVEEVFADDTVLRKKVRDILRKHMMVDEELDQEVRNRIKNLEEGTQAWELEYKRAMDQIKRKHGLE